MDADKRQMFFSDRNKGLLLYNLRRECEQKYGGLNETHNSRLEKALGHYMREVFGNAEVGMPIAALNREVVAITRRDFDAYLQRPAKAPAPRAMMDTGKAMELIQKERQGSMPTPPAMPDFRLTNESEDGPTPMELYELAKRQREREAVSVAQQEMPARVATTKDNYDLRNEILAPTSAPALRTGMQDTLIREESKLQYRENELNLFISSADRNWAMDSLVSMNRYNFTVNFDPANNSQSATITPSAHKKFKNIVRIELVKLIVPKEALDILLLRTDATPTPATNVQTNVLSFPSVAVQVSELDGNNYGTNDILDRAFGIVHYDAQWSSDPAGGSAISATATSTTTTGYVSLIPKFLKCQRVYEPTPLATLQKLSLQIQRPNTPDLLSTVSDVVSVSMLRFGINVGTSIYRTAAGTSSYIFVGTSTYFSRFMWEAGDRLRLAVSVATPGGTSAATNTSITNMLQFLNQQAGLLLVGIGYSSDLSANPLVVNDGPNSVGYGNVLIFQNRFADPTTGSTSAYSWGTETDMNTAFQTSTYSGNTINLNHQVHAVFRIITRDLDPTTKLRPDNTF